jgi:hypothetical protein
MPGPPDTRPPTHPKDNRPVNPPPPPPPPSKAFVLTSFTAGLLVGTAGVAAWLRWRWLA